MIEHEGVGFPVGLAELHADGGLLDARAEGRVGIRTRSATAIPGSIRSIRAGPVSMKTHCQPSLTSSSMASAVASISNSLGFFVRPRRVHQLARLSCGSRSSSATRLLSSAARTARALESVVLPTPPLGLAKRMTRRRAGVVGMRYLEGEKAKSSGRATWGDCPVPNHSWYLRMVPLRSILARQYLRAACPHICWVPCGGTTR